MSHTGSDNKHALILLIFMVFMTIFITTSFTYEQKNPISNILQKRQDGGDGPKKVIDPSSTCTSRDDPRCQPPPGFPPIVETYVEIGTETITPTPIPGGSSYNSNNLITTITTETLYFASSTKTITTTNYRGDPTTFVTSIPPSTLLIIKTIVTTPTTPTKTMGVLESSTNLSDFSSHNIWGVTMSLALVAVTLIFMVFV